MKIYFYFNLSPYLLICQGFEPLKNFFFFSDAEGDIIELCKAKENENEKRRAPIQEVPPPIGGYADPIDNCRWWPFCNTFAGVIDITGRDTR